MISIIVPVFNEEVMLERTIRALLDRLPSGTSEIELILVENGSTDSTVHIVDELARSDPRVRAIHLPRPDYGHALRQGFLAGSGDFLVNFSVDWIDLSFLQAALSRIDQYDIVLGSKFMAGSSGDAPLARRAGSFLFHVLERLLFGLPMSDTHGIKLLRREKASSCVQQCQFGGEAFDTEFLARACRAGLSFCEIPVRVEEKRAPRIGVWKRAWRGLTQLVHLRLSLWMER